MKTTSKSGLTLFVIFLYTVALQAVPATKTPYKITQADGTEITIQLHGDEFHHYKTTVDGYILTPNKNGILTYGELNSSGGITSTEIKARDIEKRTNDEKLYLKKLSPNIDFNKKNIARRARRSTSSKSITHQKAYPLTGAPKSLVILVSFSDLNYVTPDTKTAYTNLLNQVGYNSNGGTGSARDYFIDNSMGTFSPTFDVVGPFALPGNMASYGTNNSDGEDSNARQMVIDACTKAYNSGVDFSNYDTDNDGIVDNVFIYYAGYNEAENGPANSIWPHRFDLGNYNTKFNGVSICDYACTSELRSNSGTNMCGIGTFVHEFGHVLGLPDYYATNDSKHQTLSHWSTMDAGPYLNNGRTPPAYSAFDRFYLNWLTPIELKTPESIILNPLTTSNQAYLITQNGNHNLNGRNPSPVEFITLENRQNTGWDNYLPGHGMIISRIYYNENDWYNNSVNNDALAMGVDIIEADQIASNLNLGGDPFPGTREIRNYTPTTRSGVSINKSITEIVEELGIIKFQFLGGNRQLLSPLAENASEITSSSFIANWQARANQEGVTFDKGYYLTAYTISDGESSLKQEFQNGLTTPPGWTLKAAFVTTAKNECGNAAPAIKFTNTNDTIETEAYLLPVSTLSFFAKPISGESNVIKVEGWNESSWIQIANITLTNTSSATKSFIFKATDKYKQFRITNSNIMGSVSIDDISAKFSQNLEYAVHEKWVEAKTDTIRNIIPDRVYHYKVRASDKTLNSDKTILFENITDFSNTIEVKTLEETNFKVLRVNRQADGSAIIILPNLENNIFVYNIFGQKIMEITPTSNTVIINNLNNHQLYIFKAGSRISKVIM